MRKPAFLSNERLSRFLVSMLLAMGLLLPLMFTFEAESALALAIASATAVTVLCTALGTLRRGRLVLGIVGGAPLAVQLVLPHMGLIGWAMEAFKAVSLYLNGVTAAAPLFARQLGLTLGVTVAGISYLFSSRNVGFLPATILVVLMLFGMWSLCQADVVKLSDEEVDLLWGCSPQEGARRLLEECGVSLAMVTLGPRGCYLQNRRGSCALTAPQVSPVDTTGAGDIFGGSALHRLLDFRVPPEELDRGGLEEIARFSVTAASLSTQHPGGIPSIPELAQVVARMGEPAPLSL